MSGTLNLSQTALLVATQSKPAIKLSQSALMAATTSIPRISLTQSALLVATKLQTTDTSYQHITLSQKQATDQIVQLFTIDCSSLGLSVYHWTPGQFATEPYIYQGITYIPYPIEVLNWALSNQGTQPRPKLSISNYGGFVGGLVIQAGDLLGAKVTRIRTYARFLDNGSDPDPNAHWAPETFFIDRKSNHGKTNIEWELATPLEQKNVKIPGRLCIKNYCYFRYRVYNGTSFDYNTGAGACPWVGANGGAEGPGPYYDFNDQPTSNPADDACSNQLSGCIKRYGLNGSLPYGGFPGMTESA